MVGDDLIDAVEVARLLGVSRRRVMSLTNSEPDFPHQSGEIGGWRVWSRKEMEAWAVAHPDRGEPREKLQVPPPGLEPPTVRVIHALAVGIARDLNHSWIGLEHLLLALLHPDCPGVAGRVLSSFGLSLENARAALVDAYGDPFTVPPTWQKVSTATRLVLERAILKTHELEDDEVTGEHVLLALTDAWDGGRPIAELHRRGIGPTKVRERVIAFTEGRYASEALSEPEVHQDDERTISLPLPALSLNPLGRDPRRRRPWGSLFFCDESGEPVRIGTIFRQYFVDRDGYPVLTMEGRPVHLRMDDRGRFVEDHREDHRVEAVDIPPGAILRRRVGQ